jgi:hypothetical protein
MEEFGIHAGPIPEPGEVVEGFDDTDEIDLDLEDEPVPLSIEVLILLVFSSKGEGVGSHAMLYYLDSNGICTCLLLKFVSPILVSASKKP